MDEFGPDTIPAGRMATLSNDTTMGARSGGKVVCGYGNRNHPVRFTLPMHLAYAGRPFCRGFDQRQVPKRGIPVILRPCGGREISGNRRDCGQAVGARRHANDQRSTARIADQLNGIGAQLFDQLICGVAHAFDNRLTVSVECPPSRITTRICSRSEVARPAKVDRSMVGSIHELKQDRIRRSRVNRHAIAAYPR